MMRRKLIAINLALLLLFGLLPVSALAAGITLRLGQTITAQNLNEDGYTFTPSASGLYVFTVSATRGGEASSCGDLIVYPEADAEEAWDHTEDGVSHKNGWQWTTFTRTLALKAGTKYVVKQWNEGYADRYTLSVAKLTPQQLTSSLSFTVSDSVLFFQFTPSSSGWYTVNSSIAGEINIYDASLSHVLTGAFSYSHSAPVTAGMTYFITFERSYFDTSQSKRGTIQVSPASFPAISAGTPGTVARGESESTAFLTFTPEKSGSYSFTAEKNKDTIYAMSAFSSTGEHLTGGYFNVEGWDAAEGVSISCWLSAGKTYYIGVYSYSEFSISAAENGASSIPIHSTDEEQILNAALSQTDLTNLLPEITSGMDKLRGPEITIAGKTFYLFEITSKLDIDLGKKGTVQAEVDYENKTLKVLLGFKPVKESMTIVGDPNSPERSDLDFMSAYTAAKSLYKMTLGNQFATNTARFRSKFQGVYDELQAFEMDMIVNASGRICGYVEFSYETGRLKPSEGGVILSVNVDATQNARIPSFRAAYVTLRFGVSAEGNLCLKADDDGIIFDPEFDAELTTAIGVGLGKNTGKFQAYIEGGFDGALGAHIRPASRLTGADPLSIDMTGNLYFSWKLKAWLLEDGDIYKKQLFKLGLYPRLEVIPEELSMESFLASARPVTRGYLQTASVQAVNDNHTFSKIEYPYSEPALLRLYDGRLLMVWVGDSGVKADGDRTSIYYAVYSSGHWSSPAIIHESGTYNDHPVLCTDGQTVYAVWMRADKTLGGMEADEALRHMDLVCSSFDGTVWSTPVLLSQPGNQRTETDYVLTAAAGTVSAAWIENSQNDLLMAGGRNSIHMRSLVNGAWTPESTVYETSDVITGLNAYQGDGVQLVFSVTSDDTATTYLRAADGTLSAMEGAGREAKWVGGQLYELRDTALYCGGQPTGLEGLTNFEIVTDGRQTVALTLLPSGFTCELFGSYYDAGSGAWGALVQLTGYGKYIRNYSAVLDESGKIVAALNLVSVNADAQQVYDNRSAQLVVLDDCGYNDLVVSDWLSYDDARVAPGALLPISFQITNNSAETLQNVHISANGQTWELSCGAAPGETMRLTVDYRLPANISGHTVTLTVTPDYSRSEADTANNTASAALGLADLVTTVSAPEPSGNGAAVAINVRNAGYADAENVRLTIYRSNAEGDVLREESLGTISAGSSTVYSFPLPADMLYPDDPDTLFALNAEVFSDSDEREYGNNGDRLVFANALPIHIRASVGDASAGWTGVSLDISLENRQEHALDSTLVAAVYDDSGRMLEVTTGDARLDTGARSSMSLSLFLPPAQKEGALCVKAYWLDRASGQPLATAWEKRFQPGEW